MEKKPDFYKTLGLSNDASEEEIKKAYREKAKETHPDKGGEQEKFAEVNMAYAVLSIPQRRKQYDAGEDVDLNPPQNLAQAHLLNAFAVVAQKAMQEEALEWLDLIEETRKILLKDQATATAEIAKAKKRIAALEKALLRVRLREGEGRNPNLLRTTLEQGKNELKEKVQTIEKSINLLNDSLSMLSAYEIEPGIRPMQQGTTWSFST